MAVKLSRRALKIAQELGIDPETIDKERELQAAEVVRIVSAEVRTEIDAIQQGSLSGALKGYAPKVFAKKVKIPDSELHRYQIYCHVEPSASHAALGINVFDLLDSGRKALTAKGVNNKSGGKPSSKKKTIEKEVFVTNVPNNKPYYSYKRKFVVNDKPEGVGRGFYNKNKFPLWQIASKSRTKASPAEGSVRGTIASKATYSTGIRREPRAKFVPITFKLNLSSLKSGDRAGSSKNSSEFTVNVPSARNKDKDKMYSPIAFASKVDAVVARHLYRRIASRVRDTLKQKVFRRSVVFQGYDDWLVFDLASVKSVSIANKNLQETVISKAFDYVTKQYADVVGKTVTQFPPRVVRKKQTRVSAEGVKTFRAGKKAVPLSKKQAALKARLAQFEKVKSSIAATVSSKTIAELKSGKTIIINIVD